MSTGLTYVRVIGATWDSNTVYAFSSYQEAYDWGLWQMRVCNVTGSSIGNITLWTSGPNPNGYWQWIGTPEPVFTPYD